MREVGGKGRVILYLVPAQILNTSKITFYSDGKTVAPVPVKKILKRSNYFLLEFIHAMTHLITKVTQTVATSPGT